MKRFRMAAISVLFIATMASAQQAPDGLQFNVPYLCNDGRTYVVHRCEKGPKFEACFYQTGTDSERYNTREAVVYQMIKMCKIAGPSAPSATAPAQQSSDLNNSRWDCGSGASMTVFECQKQSGQDVCMVRVEMNGKFLSQLPKPRNEIPSHLSSCKALPRFDPAYLAEFPNHYHVVQGMLVGNPADNSRRAIGAYYQLSEIIKVLAGSRPLTPDEQKFIGDYSRLSSEFVQAAEKMFPGQHFDLASNPFHYKTTDPRFGFEGIPVWTTFLSPNLQAAYARMIGGNNDEYVVKVEQEKHRAMQQLQADAQAQQAEASYAKDAGSVAVRKCIESGRSQIECLTEGFKVGMGDLAGKDSILTKAVQDNKDPGLRLSGIYSSAGASMVFQQDVVAFTCGGLLPEPRSYSVQQNGLQIRVTVAAQLKPLVFSFQDGKLIGPEAIDVAGRVQSGPPVATHGIAYQTHTEKEWVNPTAFNSFGPGEVHSDGMGFYVNRKTLGTDAVQTTRYEIPTEPKTVRCNLGMVPATGETLRMTDTATTVLGSEGSKSQNTKPGLRLNGTYAAQGGLSIEFRDDSATLECGEAGNSEGYAVVPEDGHLVVKFDNRTGPFSLILQSNGTLTGSGSVDVAGRKVYQAANGGLAYTPQNARCTVGTLAPQAR